jgi:hypothetical protein
MAFFTTLYGGDHTHATAIWMKKYSTDEMKTTGPTAGCLLAKLKTCVFARTTIVRNGTFDSPSATFQGRNIYGFVIGPTLK